MSGLRIAVHGATGRLGRLIAAEAGPMYAGPVGRSGPVPDCDVVIDVSTPDGLRALLPRLSGQPLVVGTTGDLPDLGDYAVRAPVAVVPNFSAGVPVLLDLLREAVARLPGWQIEVVEAIGAPVPTHSLRLGDVVGEHTVWLAGPGERLELKHVATRREVFAIGAIRWARQMAAAGPGLIQG